MFGFFIERPHLLPHLPVHLEAQWPPQTVLCEAEVRFPWPGGRHPWLDVLLQTPDALIGIESKRFEPFRGKSEANFSNAYWRPVWGDQMERYCLVRDGLHDGTITFEHLDAAQLVKHAYGLRSTVHKKGIDLGKAPVLLYLYCEPEAWSDGRSIPRQSAMVHRSEIEKFAKMTAGDEVVFRHCSYRDLLLSWRRSVFDEVRRHVESIKSVFAV